TMSGQRKEPRKFACRRGKVNSGNSFARQGVTDYAQKLYQEAIAENKKNHEARYNLGLILEAGGDYATACEHFEKAMNLCQCDLYIAAFHRARSAGGFEVATPRVTAASDEKETPEAK